MKLNNSFVLAVALVAGSINLNADPYVVTINPASISSKSEDQVLRTLTVVCDKWDISKLKSSDFVWYKPGTTTAQPAIGTAVSSCTVSTCKLQVTVAADFSGMVDLHVEGQGKSAELKVITESEADLQRAKANAAYAAGRVRSYDAEIKTIRESQERQGKKLDELLSKTPPKTVSEEDVRRIANEVAKGITPGISEADVKRLIADAVSKLTERIDLVTDRVNTNAQAGEDLADAVKTLAETTVVKTPGRSGVLGIRGKKAETGMVSVEAANKATKAKSTFIRIPK